MVNAAAPPYQEAPERTGYQHKLEFAENVADNDGKRKRKQKRDITFFNPPFNLDVKTKIGREFLYRVFKKKGNKVLVYDATKKCISGAVQMLILTTST